MGAEVNGKDAGSTGRIEPTAGAQAGGIPAGTGAPDTGTGAGGRTGGRTGAGTGTETEKEKPAGLDILTEEERAAYAAGDDKEKKRILKNARRRVKYAEDKANGGGTVRPRKVRKAKTEAPSPVDTTQLNAIILTVSGIIASRPNCEHWLLTDAEAESISKPLAGMLAESEFFKNAGQYSNQIALVMACMTIFVPRLMITAAKVKEEKKRAITGQHTDTNIKQPGQKTKNPVPAGSPDGRPAADHKNDRVGESWFGGAMA